MKTYVSCLAILCALAADAYSSAHAAGKSTTTVHEHKSITVYTRQLPRPSVFKFMMHEIREPAPKNGCPVQNAFEVLNNRAGEARCVRIDQ